MSPVASTLRSSSPENNSSSENQLELKTDPLLSTATDDVSLSRAFHDSAHQLLVQTPIEWVKEKPDDFNVFDKTSHEMSPQFLIDIVHETSARLDESNSNHGLVSALQRMRREYEISNQLNQSSGLL